MNRRWIDWNEPFLPAAAGWLIDRGGGDGGLVDLERFACVTPGRQAGRSLLESLILKCREAGLRLVPPAILTPGLLRQALPSTAAPIARREERILAWERALGECDRDAIAALIPVRDGGDDPLAFHGLAATIESLHEELAGQSLRFADVPARAEGLEMFAEGDRWRALQIVAERYRKVLADCGLIDAHEALVQLIETEDVDSEQRLVLLAVTDLNAPQRAIVAKFGDRADALIHAPQALAERFDELGCIVPDAWQNVELSITDEQIVAVGRPADQAQAAVRSMAALNGAYAADQITVGLGDPDLAGALERAADFAGVTVHPAAGIPLVRTGPYRLLEAIGAWLGDTRFAHFAELLRHPDIERCMKHRAAGVDEAVAEWLTLLDEYFSDHLHGRLTGRWLGKAERRERLKAVWDAVHELLAPLRGGKRKLGHWCPPVLEVLAGVYEGMDDEPGDAFGHATIAACVQLRDVAARLADVTDALQPATGAAEAIELLLVEAAGEAIAANVRADQVEMLGWLELHLDPAPVLILTGCNDGAVPESVSADLFLPDALRRVLGLMHNAQRYARDAYLLEAVRHCKQRLTIITGRRSADGEPLQPSRVLLACDDETLLGRVKRLCAEEDEHPARVAPIGAPSCGERSLFTIPELPADLAAPESMTVTEFRAYLACPYRYALGKLVGLGSMGDDADELDALQFGILAHDVLDAFGSDESIRDTGDPDAIEGYLLNALEKETAACYGREPLPAIRVQVARLAQRLTAFAKRQAALRSEGWVIVHSEFKFEGVSLLDIPGDKPMRIRGKIDRIDRNESTGAWRIIDYKTGERGDSPHKAHHGVERLRPPDQTEWQDLQLPLYRYLAQLHGIKGNIELAYIVLPKSADDVDVKLARWEPAHLDAAIETARQVVRDIRAGRFERNLEFDSPFDEFAHICQTLAFTDPEDATGGGGGES